MKSTGWPRESHWHELRLVPRMQSKFAEPQVRAVSGTVDDLASTILRYLTSFPDACDTAEGICEWWIPRQRQFDAMQDVLAALQRLETDRRIDARRMADGRVLYSAARIAP
jgi:hypothetical protein